jgi:hypothetical protein
MSVACVVPVEEVRVAIAERDVGLPGAIYLLEADA